MRIRVLLGNMYLFKTIHGTQGEKQKFMEHSKTSTWQQHPLPVGELFFQFVSSNRDLGYFLLSFS